MNRPIDIERFTESDRDGVVALWNIVFPEEPAQNAPSEMISRKQAVQPELFFVARQHGEVVGTVMAGFDGVRGWVHKLSIHPDLRRQGLASKLMQRAEAALKAAGCPKLNLQVRATNAGVVKFYESLGYSVEERVSLGKPLD
ncbi:MAG: GNAT family acetyltransferase [Pseudomonadota bacterium]